MVSAFNLFESERPRLARTTRERPAMMITRPTSFKRTVPILSGKAKSRMETIKLKIPSRSNEERKSPPFAVRIASMMVMIAERPSTVAIV